MEVFFPDSSKVDRRFAAEFVELRERELTLVGPASVTPFLVKHASGAPAYALRVEYGGKVITYSGDTEWTESLVDAARGADLFVCEAYFFEKKVKYHLDYQTLRENRQRLECRRVVLTHMSADMLSRRSESDMECADDGQVIVVESHARPRRICPVWRVERKSSRRATSIGLFSRRRAPSTGSSYWPFWTESATR